MTWDWTQVSQTIGKHSTHLTNSNVIQTFGKTLIFQQTETKSGWNE